MSHWSGQQSDHILPYFEEYERLNPDVSIRFEPVTYAELLTGSKSVLYQAFAPTYTTCTMPGSAN